MSDNDVIQLTDHRPDPEPTVEQMALTYKASAAELLNELMILMREAERGDFRIEFAIQRDLMGIPFYTGLHVIKRFT